MTDKQAWLAQAADVLARHDYGSTGLDYIGAGAQSRCYGTGQVAVLLNQAGPGEQVEDLTGHVLPGSGDVITSNTYVVQQWITGRAADAGVRTPRILAVGLLPRPYAIIERARGTLASTHPRFQEHASEWFGKLGAEIRTTHSVETTGFGMLVPDESAKYRGRFATWAAYLDEWLAVHLCIGRSRPEDQRVLDLLLAQDIVSERDFAALASRVCEAQRWPVTSVLTHYDNRAENLVVEAGEITVLDWGLSLAGIGISQELIKLFETEPTSMESPRVAAFLHGYGLSHSEGLEAIDKGKLMLVLEGLGMSYGWADNDDRLEGIRSWLKTVKRYCSAW